MACPGTKTTVKIKQKGGWFDLESYDPKKPTEEVVFEDDGEGYDAGLLSVLFSPKAADVMSVGQFGEGLKLVAAAAQRFDIDLEYQSKNWIAKPYTKPENIGGNHIERLCFEIIENGHNVKGSRTRFLNPAKELMDEIAQLPKKVLALNNDYKVLFDERDKDLKKKKKHLSAKFLDSCMGYMLHYHSRIIDLVTHKPAIFIKGVRFEEFNSMFSYDLGIDNIHPDRKFLERDGVLRVVGRVLRRCDNRPIIDEILKKAHKDSDSYTGCLEFDALGFSGSFSELYTNDYLYSHDINISSPISQTSGRIERYMPTDIIRTESRYLPEDNPWVEAFYDMFGKDAVLASGDPNADDDAIIMGYKPIRLDHPVARYLSQLGIQGVEQIDHKQIYRWINPEDLSPDEKQKIDMIPEINQIVLGEEFPADIGVYSGVFLASGREIECASGVYTVFKDGRSQIGIKRSQLGKLEDFVSTYIHELGHAVTKCSDHERGFVDFFVNALSKITMHYMGDKR